MRHEIENPCANTACVQQAGHRLQQVGVSPQVHKRADRTAFFLMEGEERMPVYVNGQVFQTGGGVGYTRRDLLDVLEAQPERFSPSAVLRPIVQDAVYPTAAAILGPGEMAYHFLLEDIYAMHATPRPAVIPRMGCTLVESRDLKTMEKAGITFADLTQNPAALVKRNQREENRGPLSDQKQAAHEAVQGYFELLNKKAAEIDPTITRVLDKNAHRILADLQKSEELLIRRAAAQDEALAARIEGLQAALLPNGGLQERTYTIFAYYLKYGPDFLASFKALPRNPVDGAHVFVQIP
jgi:bacillithiol synthase